MKLNTFSVKRIFELLETKKGLKLYGNIFKKYGLQYF